MNENISDVELERFLRRRDRISQEYAALPAQGPAAELDAAILERARRALEEEPPASGWWRSRWPRITALAATVVLSFAAIVRLAIETDEPLLAPLAARPQAAAPADSASEPRPTAARVDDGAKADNSAADESTFAAPPAIAPGAAPLERPAGASKSAYAFEPREPAPQPAAPPATAADANASALRAESLRSSRDVAQVAPPPAVLASPRETDAAKPMGAESAQHGAAEAKQAPLSDEARRRLQKREAVMAERAKAVVSKEAVAPSPPRTPRPPHDTTDSVTVTGTATPAMAPPDADTAATSANAPEEPQAQRDPATWLREIERLRSEGLFAEAARELERLREAYPDYEPARALAPTR